MKTLYKMYKHLNWANERILEALMNNNCDDKKTNQLFSHLLFAEQIWLYRLKGAESSHLPLWEQADLETCSKLVKRNAISFNNYLEELQDSDLDHLITYKNSKGQEFTSSIQEILSHIALHGQYHRGQINIQLRLKGTEPVNVDFITFVRE